MEFDKAKRQKRNIILADAGLLMAALFWGGGFVAGKFALVDLSPMNIMAYRYVGAALVLAIFCIGRFRKVTKKWFCPEDSSGY